jgi:hypothetical protein
VVSYFTNRVKLHDQLGPRLRTSVRRGWMGLPGHSSWFPSTEVDGAWDGSWRYRCFTWLLNLPTWGRMGTG